MNKAPVWKGTGLVPIKSESKEEKVHVFGKNLEDRIKTDDNTSPVPFEFGTSKQSSESSQQIEDEDIETIKKRKYDAITGEENEDTVFQGDFKLFCWDLKTSNWVERGQGQLKLNDSIQDGTKKSRLIMRLGGTFRINLNVSINNPHFKVITNSKTNIRFTDGLRLWAAKGQNAQVLKELIEKRATPAPTPIPTKTTTPTTTTTLTTPTNTTTPETTSIAPTTTTTPETPTTNTSPTSATTNTSPTSATINTTPTTATTITTPTTPTKTTTPETATIAPTTTTTLETPTTTTSPATTPTITTSTTTPTITTTTTTPEKVQEKPDSPTSTKKPKTESQS